jgi:septal ring factor EnvC (AmiA/AmiB activator)
MASKRRSDLVVRDKQGEIYSVRYEAVNAMLLNEFLKEHKKVDEQEASIAQLKSTVAKQQKDFETTAAKQQREIQVLTAQLKEQAAQIQKVSAQLEMSKPAPQIVRNNP